jgi:hypothetical protein
MVLSNVPRETIKWAAITGVIYLIVGIAITGFHRGSSFSFDIVLNNPFILFLHVLALVVHFGLGFGAYVSYKEYSLAIPALIIFGFVLWSVGVTVSNWPSVILTGNDGYDPFSLYPVPYLDKWVPLTLLTIVGAGVETIFRQYILE